MATTSSSWTRFMLLQPFTQPTRAEYQTWPRMRARSLMSGGWGSPMARVMIPSIRTDTCCWHSMAAGSGEARAVNTAPTSCGWRPMDRRARSRASMTRSAGVPPWAGLWASRLSSCSTQWTREAASRWSLLVKYR